MKVVTVKRELSGSATLGRPTVYSCEGWEISIRRGHVVSVKSPEGDPDNKVVAEMVGAILKDQLR